VNPTAVNLNAAALRWKGTPFQARARICGAGVDCVQLAAALIEEAGLATGLAFSPYAVDFGDHADTSPVLAWFDVHPEWAAVPLPEVEAGDVVVFRVGKVANHVGVALGDQRFCHCLRGHGVLISRLDDPTYARRWVRAYRPCSIPPAT